MAAVVYAVVAIPLILGTYVWLVRSGSLDEIPRERKWRRVSRSCTTRERQRIADARNDWSH